MAVDQPVISYRRKKTNADGSRKHTKEEMDALWKRWQEKKRQEGSLVGKKIDLGAYVRGEV